MSNLGKYSEGKSPPNKQEFESYVERIPWSGCWVWMRGQDGKGYGEFRREAQKYKAHRYSYSLYRGQIGSGLFVCHHCDNPSCVNPEHLFVGSNLENQRDSYRKGRHASLHQR